MKRLAQSRAPKLAAELVDLGDDLAISKNFVAGAFLACHGLNAGGERAALCAMSDAGREKLEGALARLDAMIAQATRHRARSACSPKARAARRQGP